jgi:hypothetical protein
MSLKVDKRMDCAGCLSCFGAPSNASESGKTAATAAPPKRVNRLNLEPQELYMVDDFPMDVEEAQRWVVVRKSKPDAKYRCVRPHTMSR